MAHVGAVEHGFRVLLLDLFQKIFHDLGAAFCASPVLELQIQQFIIVGLHPQVQKLCIRIREFHKQIPHSFFVILAPDGKFPIQNLLITVRFSVKIDFALRPVFYITPEQTHQQGHNQHDGGIFPASGLCFLFHSNSSFISVISAQKRLGQWVIRPFSLWRALISSVL